MGIKSLLELRPKQSTLKKNYYLPIIILGSGILLKLKQNPSDISSQYKKMTFSQFGSLTPPGVLAHYSHFIHAPAKPTLHSEAHGNTAFSQQKTKRKSGHWNCMKFKLGLNPNNIVVIYIGSFHIFKIMYSKKVKKKNVRANPYISMNF